MASVIEEIKAKIRVEELIGQTLTVVGRGRTLTTAEHDSLKIQPEWGTWHWYSQEKRGDIFDWHQLQHGCDFRTALRELAAQAGVALAPLKPEDERALEAARRQTAVLEIAARFYHGQLMSPAGAAARAYCRRRGWTDATLVREGLGYCPGREAASCGDKRGLSAEEREADSSRQDAKAQRGEGEEVPEYGDIEPMWRQLRKVDLHEEPMAKAVLMAPPGSLIYVHRERGRAVYLSARSIEGKRHWNLPTDLAGPRRLYVASADPEQLRLAGVRVLVEGQADAISLGQLGVQATALCGVAPGEALMDGCSHVGLDGDAAGQAKAVEVALRVGPLTRLVRWPAGKDANEWLLTGPTAAQVAALFTEGQPALLALAEAAQGTSGEVRSEVLRQVFDAYAGLDEMTAADLKPALAKALGQSVGQVNRLIKARQREEGGGAGEKAGPDRYEHTAGLVKAGLVAEMCLIQQPGPEGGPAEAKAVLAVRLPDGRIEMRGFVDIGATTYVPYPADMGLIEKQVVLFPTEPTEYHSQRALVQRILVFIHKYLDIDPFYERLAAYYVLLSWVYDLFETLPYIRALGDYGTGKTRFLQTIGALCYRPMFVSGASTTSPIFRMIDMFQGTLVIDEADFGNSDAEAEIIKILNVGYYRGGVVLRSEKDPTSKYDEYWPSAKSVYGPKILATRRPFTDRATESRCLTKRTTTARPRPDIPFMLGREFWEEALALRNQLLMYRLRNHRPVTVGMELADSSVEPRLNQVTMALKAVVDSDDMRREIDLFIRAYNATLISDRQMTLPALVVQALTEIWYTPKRNLMGEDERDFSMKGIADRTQALVNEIDPGTQVTAKKVGQILSEELGLTGRRRNTRHRRVELALEERDLTALMARYGVNAPGAEGAL